MTLYADVVLSLPLEQTFTYAVPDRLKNKASVGSRALVPFRQKDLTALIVRRRRKVPADIVYKELTDILDESPVLTPAFLAFSRKLADDSFSSWG